jgi:hypothetical protein
MTVMVARKDSMDRQDNMDTHRSLTTKVGVAGLPREDIMADLPREDTMADLHREECTTSNNRRWATIKISAVDTVVQAQEGSVPAFWARWHAAAASICWSRAVANEVMTIHSCTLSSTKGENKGGWRYKGYCFRMGILYFGWDFRVSGRALAIRCQPWTYESQRYWDSW